MHKLKQLYTTTPRTMFILLWLLLGIHLLFTIHSFATLGIGFSSTMDARSWIMLLFTTLWFVCCTGKKSAYYIYIFTAILFYIIPKFIGIEHQAAFKEIALGMFPMNLLFACILIWDLKRLIIDATRN